MLIQQKMQEFRFRRCLVEIFDDRGPALDHWKGREIGRAGDATSDLIPSHNNEFTSVLMNPRLLWPNPGTGREIPDSSAYQTLEKVSGFYGRPSVE
jgi:hypothetical protein